MQIPQINKLPASPDVNTEKVNSHFFYLIRPRFICSSNQIAFGIALNTFQ